jgi:hypothetical protein
MFHAKICKQTRPLHDLSKVFMHHLSLCLSLPPTQLNATDSAVGIITSPSELDIVTNSYSCNRLSGLENKFWSWHGVFVNTVQKHRFRTMFYKICWQTMFALVCIRLYNTENSLTKRSTPHMPTQCNPKHPKIFSFLFACLFYELLRQWVCERARRFIGCVNPRGLIHPHQHNHHHHLFVRECLITLAFAYRFIDLF